MRSEFKSATQIYVSPIHFEIKLILGNDLFCIPVEHILLSCTKYKTKREVVFKDHYTNGSEPTMKSILQESNIFSVNAIMQFLTEVDLLDNI